MVCAIRRGLGVGMLPTYVGDQEPALRRLEEPDLTYVADLWVLSHPDLRTNARYRAVRSYVGDALRRHAPLFRGDCPADAPTGSESGGGPGEGHPIA